MLHLLEERDRIEAADRGVRRIVLHAEGGRVDALDDLEEDVLGLRELRVPPGAVLVVVLHAEDDAALLGVLERAGQAVERARDPVGARHPRVALAAQRAAMTAAEPERQIDRRLLPLDLTRPLVGIRMREVRREADQRRRLAGLGERGDDRVDVGGVERSEEAVVVLDAFAAERRRLADPGQVVARAGDEVVEPALGEDGDAGSG